jgi:hypothetical protein
MRLRPRKLTCTLPLLLATSIAVSGFGELALASRCIDAPNDSASCSASGCCCSQGSDEPRACCCVKRPPAPQAPSSDANKSHSDLELAPWAQPAFAAASATEGGGLLFSSGVQRLSPSRPSVLLLLCTWRL